MEKMGHILIVEDHACFRQTLGLVLGTETDFLVNTQAGPLAEARACLSGGRAESIDAAIIGLGMPEGDGADLIHEIGLARGLAHAKNPNPVILGITSHKPRPSKGDA
jgi:DNA-binding NarL/FixJ family response regulator